jgi:hypothetical protein
VVFSKGFAVSKRVGMNFKESRIVVHSGQFGRSLQRTLRSPCMKKTTKQQVRTWPF